MPIKVLNNKVIYHGYIFKQFPEIKKNISLYIFYLFINIFKLDGTSNKIV